MIQKFSLFFFIAALTLFFTSSCVSRKNIAYFQDIDAIENEQQVTNKNIEIQPGDLLSIIVSAPELQAAQPFNNFRPMVGIGTGGGGGGNSEPLTYLVDEDGTIDFPTLGMLEVTGITGKELEKKLKAQLSPYLQDPLVTVRLQNFQISILGEVRSPGTYQVPNDDISLPQALGLAGDIPLTGKRKNVLVTRIENGQKSHAYLDLTDADVMDSPFYYLKQNDVVYVEPIGPRIQTVSYLGTASSYLGIASALLSIVLIFTR